jgi:hypothetical protein
MASLILNPVLSVKENATSDCGFPILQFGFKRWTGFDLKNSRLSE